MTREIDFRYMLVRDGGDLAYLNPVTAPSIRCDSSGEIKTCLSGTFLQEDLAVWTSDEIRAEMILDGQTHALGIFLPSSVRINDTPTSKTVYIEAFDRCWKVKDHYTESVVHYASGANYLDPVKALLTNAGIALVVETPTTATLTEDREDWDIGTSYLEIINQLLSEINYNPLWFNSSGAAVLEPASVPSADNIEHQFDAKNIQSLILPGIQRETDIYSAPNVFICICSNADKTGPMVATSENTNPQSLLSTVKRGRRIAKIYRVDNIASLTELQAYANRLRNESMISGETITLTTALLPGFGVADVSSVFYEDLAAICIEKSWTMELTVGGRMTHTLDRVVINLV